MGIPIKVYISRDEVPSNFSGKLVCSQFDKQKIFYVEKYNPATNYLTHHSRFIEYRNGGRDKDP